ncbi:MAG TPA: 30S ribosomal protein S8e, partial [Methanocorpusculum sp.]|nr:30S ribosomal protein S8e [Methanocorpusculum sp.]
MLWQGKSTRKSTGGRYHAARGKRRPEIGRPAADTVLGQNKVKTIRTTGGNTKVRALRCEFANVSDTKTGKVHPWRNPLNGGTVLTIHAYKEAWEAALRPG